MCKEFPFFFYSKFNKSTWPRMNEFLKFKCLPVLGALGSRVYLLLIVFDCFFQFVFVNHSFTLMIRMMIMLLLLMIHHYEERICACVCVSNWSNLGQLACHSFGSLKKKNICPDEQFASIRYWIGFFLHHLLIIWFCSPLLCTTTTKLLKNERKKNVTTVVE